MSERKMSHKICPECSQKYTNRVLGDWCKPCYSKHFKDNFDKWTSGNETIDKIIQNSQLNANGYWEVIEWIPYDKIKYIKRIARGGFGTIHLAKWFDGQIRVWNIENQQWKRYGQLDVVLKKFDSFATLNEGFLNEMVIHLKTWNKGSVNSIQFYGITQDPETQKYIMVLDYARDGNLGEHLKNNFNLSWEKKLYYLYDLANSFRNIHKLDIIHQDFHPGNILSHDFKDDYLYISDFGLSKMVGQNPNNPEKKNIFGVLPYMAPEILCEEKYTKAADVYSFGIIAFKIITGFPPYHDIPHNSDLAIKICNGLRPKIPFHIPKSITRMIMRCWDARVTHRPTFEELKNETYKYYSDYMENDSTNNNEITIQIKKSDEFSTSTNATAINIETAASLNYRTHPQAIYTSRLLNFSNLPNPKNEENFENELKELTKSISDLSSTDSKQIDLNIFDFLKS
ncbi:hypothetical protein Glove_109g36 [Diversispora epigaea]|uniref:Protein kinase domain-containing protein n=1 Tax=Diversispora epigaea TaxID=1348612 RepID=A0A397J2P8_9GLOM|nr:hypothetical protein Glove_109g36 [Diversispora epigaea]